MSDNEDLLGDDLGDQSLADYNLGNEEEEQLLADDYENGGPQNVPSSLGPQFREPIDMVPVEYPGHGIEFSGQPMPYQVVADTECIVPNITVEVPNSTVPEHPTYAPYEPVYEPEHAVVPPAIPAAPLESPQIVPSEMTAPLSLSNGEEMGPRERFTSERPPGAQRLPQVRDIPDSLDKVVVPRWAGGGRWRPPPHYHPLHHQHQHHPHPYLPRHNNYHHMRPHRGNFSLRASFPPLQMRHNSPQIRPDIRPDIRPGLRPELRPEPDILPPPQISPERMPPEFRPENRPPFQSFPRFQFRPDEPRFGPRPNFERPMFYRPNFPRPFGPPREISPNDSQMPQVTIRQSLPMDKDTFVGKVGPPLGREPEVRMLPVQLPPHLPPGGLAGKKVLINPHFKGNFQAPVEGLPTYIPTRIQKSPPLSPTLESKFGPIKDIDDAAERFIAEQRNALARAATRKLARRSPQRYISNTTIEISNELASARSDEDAELLRRQEEFIHANRAGLRRRMRSPVPGRRSPSPVRRSPDRRSPDRRPRQDPAPTPQRHDEESEYKRRVREQESLRERVLRAKEVRRRKNAVALHNQILDKERSNQEKEQPKPDPKPESTQTTQTVDKPTSTEPEIKPDTTRKSPERVVEKVEKVEKVERDRSPVKDDSAEVNSTCENLTPPRASPERALTPPLPARGGGAASGGDHHKRSDSDDDLDLILGDIDGILSDDDDTGKFNDKDNNKAQITKSSKPQVDLRSKLPPKSSSGDKKQNRQKIVFGQDKEERKRKVEKSPPRRAVVTSSTKTEERDNTDKKTAKSKPKAEAASNLTSKSRQRIIFEQKEPEKSKDDKTQQFANRRVIIQRKITQSKDKSVFSRIEVKSDPTKPNPGIFSRAVRTAIGTEKPRIVIKKQEEPEVEFDTDSGDEDKLLNEEIGNIATVNNLPHGMTDTRLKTLAGADVQNLSLDKEERTAKITFKTTVAAESFKKKFNHKMVAASRLTVTLR